MGGTICARNVKQSLNSWPSDHGSVILITDTYIRCDISSHEISFPLSVVFVYNLYILCSRSPSGWPIRADNLINRVIWRGVVYIIIRSHDDSNPWPWFQLIDAFGRVLFEASDYRTDLNDENAIEPDLERLIERMTVAYDGILSEEDDEGYEDYEEEHHSLDHGPCTWEIILKVGWIECNKYPIYRLWTPYTLR